jgi:flagellar protein FliL
MAIVDDTTPVKQGPSIAIQAGLLVAMTGAALGIGWMSGVYLNGQQQPLPAAEEAAPKAVETKAAEQIGEIGVMYLDPVVTNLAGPVDMWVRLEIALVFDGEPDAMIAHQIHEDTLSYLRTVKSHQVEGASGFQHLRADIEERARLRSEGRVTRVLLRTLLFE